MKLFWKLKYGTFVFQPEIYLNFFFKLTELLLEKSHKKLLIR